MRMETPLAASLLIVSLPVVGRRRRDPHNWFPAVKSITDGLVLAGWWPDDTAEYVSVAEPELVVGGSLVVVKVSPQPS